MYNVCYHCTIFFPHKSTSPAQFLERKKKIFFSFCTFLRMPTPLFSDRSSSFMWRCVEAEQRLMVELWGEWNTVLCIMVVCYWLCLESYKIFCLCFWCISRGFQCCLFVLGCVCVYSCVWGPVCSMPGMPWSVWPPHQGVRRRGVACILYKSKSPTNI